jgi:hypothetical protein
MKSRFYMFCLALLFALKACTGYAQSASYALVVSSCAGQSYNIGQYAALTQLANGTPCQGTVTATTAATAQSTLPSLSAGGGNAIYESLFGGLYIQPIFGGQAVDATHGMPVNCIVGCAGGTLSNATSAVATSSTNGGANSWLYGFNGTTWDQLQVDASKFLKVNCATGCAGGTVSNASSGVATSSTNSGVLSWNYGFNGTTWDQLQVDGSKNLKVNVAAGSISASFASATTGGCTPYHLAGGTAATTNSTLIITGTHTLCSLSATNTTATVVYLRVYDQAAAPTCSSATGAVHTYPIPANTAVGGINIPVGTFGEAATLGWGYCVTGGAADTDNTAAVTGIFINGSYK